MYHYSQKQTTCGEKRRKDKLDMSLSSGHWIFSVIRELQGSQTNFKLLYCKNAHS